LYYFSCASLSANKIVVPKTEEEIAKKEKQRLQITVIDLKFFKVKVGDEYSPANL